MYDNEDSDIEENEEGRHGEGFEVGEEPVFDHIEVVFVIGFSSSLFV